MSRKYTLNNRPSSTCISSFYGQKTTVSSFKENAAKDDMSKIDLKLNQIKKKYQQPRTEIKHQEKDQNKYLYRHTGNLRQEEVLRKLENFKSELQSIPNWQNFARNVLFNEYENGVEQKKLQQPKQYFIHDQKTTKNSEKLKQNISKKQEYNDDNKLLLGSNVSFKVKQTSTIQRYGTPIQKSQDFLKRHAPTKSVNEFDIEKIKHTSKQKRFEASDNNVDKQINEIQRKIRQAELKKKMLGVQFIPFDRKIQHLRQDSSKQNLEKQFKSRTPETKFRNLQTKNMQLPYSRPPTQPKRNSKIDEFIKPKFKLNQTYDATSPRFAQTFQSSHTEINADQKIKLFIQSIKHNQNQGYSIAYKQKYQNKNAHEQLTKYSKSTILKNKEVDKEKSFWNQTQQSMKERKRKLDAGGDKRKSKDTITMLVSALCQQVKLDEKFRNSKLWFKSFKNQKKLQRLKSLLNIQGFNLSIAEIQQQFAVTEKQDNPFFSVTSQNCDIQDVARCYSECQKYWKRNISKKFSRKNLQNEDFTSYSIDLDKKDFIILQDLVRLLNMETGTFYRNRDLFTIFRRLCGKEGKISFNSFMNALCL